VASLDVYPRKSSDVKHSSPSTISFKTPESKGLASPLRRPLGYVGLWRLANKQTFRFQATYPGFALRTPSGLSENLGCPVFV
jgi:hypothetical protein